MYRSTFHFATQTFFRDLHNALKNKSNTYEIAKCEGNKSN